jgi:hypothetical protein
LLPFGVAVGGATVVVAALSAVATVPLPTGSLAFTDSDLGGPVGPTAAGGQTPYVALQSVGKGTYQLTIDYTMQGSGAGFLDSCGASPQTSTAETAASEPGSQTTVVSFACTGGRVWFSMIAEPNTMLRVNRLILTKTAIS